ncbi:VOC family protein [Halothermothrix orenii]|uniref:Glyoxalase/bleomycin resistance protein/dioxygenase n=1 Tax=Halothermothrix orenii (strain H 168 / OCM 544 / DSM 9562) TaxID=373903 RepID=B8CXY2_HALOH|nr:VOC family protein [Halothermothrix orenii]ACL70151.1 Glyoxalase/bleomycin resistance protein/dioxygenase [Halothermothrix orenii H 168]
MMKPKLESAYICVENMERAREFYEWFLNRKGIKQADSLYLFNIDGFRLFLFDHKNEDEDVIYGDNCLLSFEVEDARVLKEKLEKRGFKIVFPLKQILDNLVFEFEDTEGNHIEVFSKLLL